MAGLISDQLLDNVRTVAYQQLTTPVTVRRVTRVEGPNGMAESEADIVTTTCWVVVKAKDSMTVQAGHKLSQVSSAEIRFDITDDVQVNDILVIDGKRWVVQDTNDQATITVFLRAFCERLEPT